MADSDLQSKLVKQLEFYFGDANLSKDRFLRQKIEESETGAIPIDTVASFNRMKQLTEDMNQIRQAARTSSKLKLSEDGNYIGRTDPLPEPRNVDDRTVYAEHLPPKASHDMLRELFAPFGPVEYISIPRFPDRTIKGFAFIEYAEPESADAAAKGPVTYKDGNTDHTVKVLHKTEWLRLRQEYAKLQRQLQRDAHRAAAHDRRHAGTNHGAKKSAIIENGTVVRLNSVNPDTRKSKLKAYVRFATCDGAKTFVAEAGKLDTTGLRDGDNELVVKLLEGQEMEDYRARVDVKHSKRVPQNQAEGGDGAAGAHGDEGGPDTAVAAASDAGLSKANKKKEKKAAKKAKQHMRFDGEPGEHAANGDAPAEAAHSDDEAGARKRRAPEPESASKEGEGLRRSKRSKQ